MRNLSNLEIACVSGSESSASLAQNSATAMGMGAGAGAALGAVGGPATSFLGFTIGGLLGLWGAVASSPVGPGSDESTNASSAGAVNGSDSNSDNNPGGGPF